MLENRYLYLIYEETGICFLLYLIFEKQFALFLNLCYYFFIYKGSEKNILMGFRRQMMSMYNEKANSLKNMAMTIFGSSYDIKEFNSKIEKYISDNCFPEKTVRNIKLVFEEVVSLNLVPYSNVYYNIYPITINAEYDEKEGKLRMEFKYTGMKYDPIEGIADLSAAIVKNIAEEVTYGICNDTNHLMIVLDLS